MRDLFDRMRQDKGPLGKWADIAEGYFAFPKFCLLYTSPSPRDNTGSRMPSSA